jgi:hypothetical protein
VGEEAGVVYAPYEFLLVGELYVGEFGGVLVVEGEIGYVPRGTGDEGTVFGGV